MKTSSWLMVKAVFEGENALIFQELAAQVFVGHGIDEVELTEPGRTGLVDDRDSEYSVTGHLPDDAEGGKVLESLSADLMRLAENLSVDCEIRTDTRRNEEWSETWKRFFHPLKVTDRLVIKPSWEDYKASADEIVIEIDPGMAFGTGGHATTSMCLKLLEKWLRPGQRVWDVGTGSGILMVAAAKLGAGWILGTDFDPDALMVARENLAANSVPETLFDLRLADLARGVDVETFPLIVANLEAKPVVSLMEMMAGRLSRDAVVILSGIITEKRDWVLERLDALGMRVLEVNDTGEWCALALRPCGAV